MSKLEQISLKDSIDQMYEGIQIISFEFRYLYVNKVVAKQGKNTQEGLLGKTMMECYPGIEDTEVFSVIKKCMKTKEIQRMEHRFVFPDKSYGWFELLLQPHEQGVLIRSLDITDRKKLEFQYWQTQKMNALGKLTAQINHDLNNKLLIISLAGGLLEKQSDLTEKSRKRVADILKTVEDCKGFLTQLSSFIKDDFNDPTIININELIQRSRDQYKILLPKNIEINYSLTTEVSNILLAPSQFEQILLNLIVNAKDAMPDGGKIKIETSLEDVQQAQDSYQAGRTSGKYVKLRVSDTGSGIDPDVVQKIFDPFFSTKQESGGTGLGLSTVYGIVNQSKGFISVNTRKGLGTEFNIFVPAMF